MTLHLEGIYGSVRHRSWHAAHVCGKERAVNFIKNTAETHQKYRDITCPEPIEPQNACIYRIQRVQQRRLSVFVPTAENLVTLK